MPWKAVEVMTKLSAIACGCSALLSSAYYALHSVHTSEHSEYSEHSEHSEHSEYSERNEEFAQWAAHSTLLRNAPL